MAGHSKCELRIVVLPPDLLPRQLFLVYPPPPANRFARTFLIFWRPCELIPSILLLCSVVVGNLPPRSRSGRSECGSSPAASLDRGDCHAWRSGSLRSF